MLVTLPIVNLLTYSSYAEYRSTLQYNVAVSNDGWFRDIRKYVMRNCRDYGVVKIS